MNLLATADLHIRAAEDTALLGRILSLAREKDCTAVLIGGDLLDSPFPDEATRRALLKLLETAGLPVFLTAGNHDPLAVTALYRDLSAGVQLFPETLTGLSLDGHVRLFGCSAAREQDARPPLQGFRAPEDGVNILLTHGQMGSDSFRPVQNAELAESGLQLAILGHIHKAEQRRVGACQLLVPGIPQGRGWDETGDKHVWLIQIAENGGILLEPQNVAEVVYRELEVDLTDCREDEVLARMEAAEVPDGTVARLVLTGSPLCDPESARQLYTARYGRPVIDRTEISLSVETLQGQNTLQGAFVRRALAEIEAAPAERRPVLEEALRMGLRALKEASQ